ncbi:MAG TPA: DUF4199 domain-containing protein [Chryseolinea sp.]|nr:DUF4199 domain-containing protein [Chryseolinea sp.]
MAKTLWKVSTRYGAAAGILAFILLLVMYYVGRHPLLTSPFLDFRILLFGIFIFFTLKELRDYYHGGILYFWQAMAGGWIVILIATIATSILLWLFGIWDKNFVDSYIAQAVTYLRSFPQKDIDRIGKEIYERNLNALPATNIFDLIQTYFMQGIVIGFFVNIILSVILRRQPKT